MILKCTTILRGIECVTIHCSAHTSPEQVLLKMSQVFRWLIKILYNIDM